MSLEISLHEDESFDSLQPFACSITPISSLNNGIFFGSTPKNSFTESNINIICNNTNTTNGSTGARGAFLSRCNDIDYIKTLHKNLRSKTGITTLHVTENLEVAKWLLANFSNAATTLDKSGRSVLATQKSPEILNLILDSVPEDNRGALFVTDKNGSSPLFHNESEDCFKLLLTRGPPGLVNWKNNKGQNVLSRRLPPAETELAIAAGADITVVDIKGRNPLFFANAHFTRWLVEKNPEMVHSVDSSGNTPLFYACSVNVYEILLRYGANPNVVNKYGESPMIPISPSSSMHFAIPVLPGVINHY